MSIIIRSAARLAAWRPVVRNLVRRFRSNYISDEDRLYTSTMLHIVLSAKTNRGFRVYEDVIISQYLRDNDIYVDYSDISYIEYAMLTNEMSYLLRACEVSAVFSQAGDYRYITLSVDRPTPRASAPTPRASAPTPRASAPTPRASSSDSSYVSPWALSRGATNINFENGFTAGVELEIYGSTTLSRTAFIQSLVREGGVYWHGGWENNSHHGNSRLCWTLKTDASVHGFGLELVSPIMSSFSDMVQKITEMCALLRSLNARFDNSCGFHIHFGKQVLPRGINSYRSITAGVENYGYWGDVLPSDRLNNGYCRFSGLGEGEKYKAFAWRCDTNTVEWRCAPGTARVDKLVSWVSWCYAVVAGGSFINPPTRLFI